MHIGYFFNRQSAFLTHGQSVTFENAEAPAEDIETTWAATAEYPQMAGKLHIHRCLSDGQGGWTWDAYIGMLSHAGNGKRVYHRAGVTQ